MRSLRLHRSKRWWAVVIGISILLLSLMGYGIYSVLSWQSYTQRSEAWQQSTKLTLKSTLFLSSASDTDRKRKLAALKDTARRLQEGQSGICTPTRLTGWQLVLSGPKADHEQCNVYTQKVDQVIKQLNIVTAYLDDEAKAIAALQPALSLPAAVSEKDWDQTAAAWSAAHTAVGALKPSTAFTPVAVQVTKVIAIIDTSWRELIAAHAKKDKASFVAAAAVLQKSYDEIASIGTASTAQLDTLTAKLQSDIGKL